MKMPWRSDPPDPLETDSGRALIDAEEGLAEAQAQWPEVHRVSSSLRDLRRQNHFGDSVAKLMRGEA